MKKYVKSDIELNECAFTLKELLKAMGFTNYLGLWGAKYFDDLLVVYNDHECCRFYCSDSDTCTAEKLFEDLAVVDSKLYTVEEEYGIKISMYDSVSDLIFDVFGY